MHVVMCIYYVDMHVACMHIVRCICMLACMHAYYKVHMHVACMHIVMVGRLFQNSNVIFSFRLQYIHSRCIYSIHSRPAIVIQDFNAFKSTIIIHACMYTAKNPRVRFRPLVENGPLRARERPVDRM